MSKFFQFAALLLSFAFAQNLHAQTISAADQKGIEECFNAISAAFEKLDVSELGLLFTDNVEHINPPGELTRGRANVMANVGGYMAFLKTQPKPDRMEQKKTAWQSRYLAPDLILSTYTNESSVYYGDKSTVEKAATALVLRKVKSKWLIEFVSLTPVVAMTHPEK